jgi:predicted CoA-binding protein
LRLSQEDADRVAALMDLHEGRFETPVLDDAGVRDMLTTSRRIAIVGASPDPMRPSNGVLRDLVAAGYDVVPVNPKAAVVEGLTSYPTVAAAVAATGPVDIVDVFRRADQCVEPAREAVAVGARCLWLQLGLANREAARIAHAGGVAVVMDRCTSVEVRRMGRG